MEGGLLIYVYVSTGIDVNTLELISSRAIRGGGGVMLLVWLYSQWKYNSYVYTYPRLLVFVELCYAIS